MRIISAVGLLTLLTLVSKSYQELDEEVYGNCKAQFYPSSEVCQKFGFVSSEKAVEKGCVVPTNGTTFYSLEDLPKVESLDPRTIKMASLITNTFEDGGSNFAYASCSNINDSRGYTSGYVGFTTGTGDAEILINLFSKEQPKNRLEKYLPRIHEISELPQCDRTSRGSTEGLTNYCNDWLLEACDAKSGFSKLQRTWVYENYMLPSARYAAQSGVFSPLGRAIFYDTIIQHGYQYVEPDINIVRVLTLTGPRGKDEPEEKFLTRFLTTRRQLQCCYPDNVWPASASRCADLQSLVDDFEKNKDLSGPIVLKKFGVEINGDENIDVDRKRCSSS